MATNLRDGFMRSFIAIDLPNHYVSCWTVETVGYLSQWLFSRRHYLPDDTCRSADGRQLKGQYLSSAGYLTTVSKQTVNMAFCQNTCRILPSINCKPLTKGHKYCHSWLFHLSNNLFICLLCPCKTCFWVGCPAKNVKQQFIWVEISDKWYKWPSSFRSFSSYFFANNCPNIVSPKPCFIGNILPSFHSNWISKKRQINK